MDDKQDIDELYDKLINSINSTLQGNETRIALISLMNVFIDILISQYDDINQFNIARQSLDLIIDEKIQKIKDGDF